MIDPRLAKNVDEACSNGDGTFNGFRLLSFLSEALHPGKGLSEAEVRKAWETKNAPRPSDKR